MISLEHAACRESDPELFHPSPAEEATTRAAKAVCTRCPVRLDCLALALTLPHLKGVWGGLTGAERQAYARSVRAPQRARSA